MLCAQEARILVKRGWRFWFLWSSSETGKTSLTLVWWFVHYLFLPLHPLGFRRVSNKIFLDKLPFEPVQICTIHPLKSRTRTHPKFWFDESSLIFGRIYILMERVCPIHNFASKIVVKFWRIVLKCLYSNLGWAKVPIFYFSNDV